MSCHLVKNYINAQIVLGNFRQQVNTCLHKTNMNLHRTNMKKIASREWGPDIKTLCSEGLTLQVLRHFTSIHPEKPIFTLSLASWGRLLNSMEQWWKVGCNHDIYSGARKTLLTPNAQLRGLQHYPCPSSVAPSQDTGDTQTMHRLA